VRPAESTPEHFLVLRASGAGCAPTARDGLAPTIPRTLIFSLARRLSRRPSPINERLDLGLSSPRPIRMPTGGFTVRFACDPEERELLQCSAAGGRWAAAGE
jgi:hypothetical protein